MWIKNKLSLQMEKLEDGWDLVCSNFITFSNEKEYINARISPEIITYDMMLKSNFIGNLTGIYNREKLGIFNQVNEGHEDYIMWLDIISVTNRAYCIQECLAKYRVNEHSLSSNKIKAIAWQWNIYRKTVAFHSYIQLNISFIIFFMPC